MNFLLPVIVVTILSVLLGMLWYSPFWLGPMWMKAYKFDHKRLRCTPWHYAGGILVSFVMALILAILIDRFQIMAWQCGLALAVYLWLGFIVTTHFSGVLWAHKPLSVYFIDIAYYLISVGMMGALLAAWMCKAVAA